MTRCVTNNYEVLTEEGMVYFPHTNEVMMAECGMVGRAFLPESPRKEYTSILPMDGSYRHPHIDNLRWFLPRKVLTVIDLTIYDLYCSGRPIDSIKVKHQGVPLPSWYVESVCHALDKKVSPVETTNELTMEKINKKYQMILQAVTCELGGEVLNTTLPDLKLVLARMERFRELVTISPKIRFESTGTL